ncbi:HEAT repeat domain-containing protein [Candidatus Bipolaricaulota bacterium]|nr:HEAT repeat domain-containing protein [Candidatus Bipolaricaulota bacterium]
MSIFRLTAGWLLVVTTLISGAVIAAAATQDSHLRLQAQELVKQLADPSPGERRDAREGLLLLGAAAVPSLIAATESDSGLLRWEAVNLLGILGDLRATDAVLQVAITDSDVHARWRANWAITNLDDGTVVLRLIARLDNDDPTVAWNCAVTLSLFGVAEAVPLLHQGLDAAGWWQWEAVNALGRVWNEDTAPKLIAVLQEGPEDVRKEAALSLGHIGGAEVLAVLLIALVEDPSFEVRWRAAMMIGHIGSQETAVLLADIRAQEGHPFVIEHIDEAIEALTSQR